MGVTGEVTGKVVALGNANLLRDLGIPLGELEATAEPLRRDGATALFLAIDGKAAAVIAVADPIKPTTPDASASAASARIADRHADWRQPDHGRGRRRALGIDEVVAEVLPADKHDLVRRLRHEGHVVAMAGDGVNDAPALAAADIGIAMGTGTEVAIASAGVTLVKGDLAGIVRATLLSRTTMRNIRQNLFFAFIYNAIGVPVAAGVLYPVVGILLSPIIAALAMSFSSVSVIANALRLRRLQV